MKGLFQMGESRWMGKTMAISTISLLLISFAASQSQKMLNREANYLDHHVDSLYQGVMMSTVVLQEILKKDAKKFIAQERGVEQPGRS
ncbi:uncharacterized protein LOC121762375 isoform X3 [Salvia splendens]|uniref:uncharacterized protein LOC121762375 isoform X3 n=1 Tax=Salvia splendens TaxID=180675 RepID=UPI001C263C31|nr:uncharacterized protein LOC121762375 isoform X3 [Salvia splendens]